MNNLPNPNHPLILTWKSKKIEGALVTKIGSQRYLGVKCKDKNGQDYWRYHPLSREVPPSAVDSALPQVQAVQIEQNETIQKFTQKYGTASNPISIKK